jgi:hypothetical protein
VLTKLGATLILGVFLFFGRFWLGAGAYLQTYGYFEEAEFWTSRNSGKEAYLATVLSQNATSFLAQYSRQSFEYLVVRLHCLPSPYFDPSTDALLPKINSGWTVLVCLLAIAGCIYQLTSKAVQLYRYDVVRCYVLESYKDPQLAHSLWTVPLYEVNRACLLYLHFFLFAGFYQLTTTPCLGMVPLGLTPLNFDSFALVLRGQGSSFAARVLPCVLLPYLVCLALDLFLLLAPHKVTLHQYWSLLLLLPAGLVLLVSRVGFGEFSPLYPSFTHGFRREVFS